jgi:polysaccharide export outer membrane protein
LECYILLSVGFFIYYPSEISICYEYVKVRTMVLKGKKNMMRMLFCLLCCCQILAAGSASANDYVTGPGDVIKVTVYDNDDLTVKVRISQKGTIVMPLLGKVDINKLTIDQIVEKITRLLADGYLVNPQVNVFVEEYRSKKVVVLGNVKVPGIVELNRPITFLELISKSGGLEKDAGDTATIQRESEDAEKIIVIDLRALIDKGDISQNVMLQDGDTVFVSRSGMCYITGEVKEPGTYPCGEDSTVLKLVALSGGFTGKASKSGVRIVRIINNQKTILKDVDLDSPLKNNDVVVVPESFF